MKKSILLLFAVTMVVFAACKQDKKDSESTEQQTTEALAPVSDSMMETAVIYEANIRQYSQEGTFDAFTKDIPEIKKLGVKIIWMMPIFPISETKRKATGGDFASLIEDEAERAKMLGSYYAVTDYTKVNPEFGTIEDFRELVNTAHENGIYVILDWVPNHTGWDHIWIKEHPEYYTQNENGDIIDPINPDTGESWGWGDVADLNYDNQEMRAEMIEDMSYWITQEGIDGFRCDVAGAVPQDFWKTAISELRSKKDLFMLAEAADAWLVEGNNMFDMCYGWEGHHIMNDLAKGKKSVADFKDYLERMQTQYENDDILMNFVTNHDENSWSGSVKERMGDASNTMTALAYFTPGMPLIYSGQEYGLQHRLKFFEKDSIPKTKGAYWDLLVKLGKLKNSNAALNGGKEKATVAVLDTDNDKVLLMLRNKNNNQARLVANISSTEQQVTMPEGESLDYITNEKIEFKPNEKLTLKPWEFKILVD